MWPGRFRAPTSIRSGPPTAKATILSYIGVVSGTSTTLESYESIFNQDLNGDGVIGLYAAPGTTLQISAPLADPSGSATIGAGATLELAVADSGSVTFASSTGTLILESPSTFSGEIFNFTGNGKLSGSDQIDLKGINYNSVQRQLRQWRFDGDGRD